jgi:hypothetical protein
MRHNDRSPSRRRGAKPSSLAQLRALYIKCARGALSCISVLPHIGQNYAIIPTQNMHFVKDNQRLKLIAPNATSSIRMGSLDIKDFDDR